MLKTVKKGDIVQCPSVKSEYLTSHKEYVITKVNNEVGSFVILDDNGQKLYCVAIECGHLNGKNWIFK